MIPNSQEAVNFLLHIFEGSIELTASILCAQAEGHKDVIIAALQGVKDFCDEQIKKIDTDGYN